MSKIIFLNGCGSSGKTSIARSIQYLSDEHWFTFGVDTFIQMTPYPAADKEDAGYFHFVPGENEHGPTMSVEAGPKGNLLFGLMPEFARLLADKGNNVIIDEVLFDDTHLKRYIKELVSHTVYFVGVMCDISVMQEREFLRRDRAIGLSNDQVTRVHQGMRKYDLVIDTSLGNVFDRAKEIIDFININAKPEGFNSMRGMN